MFAVIKVTLDVLRIHLLLSQSLSLLHESNLFTDLKSIRNMPDQNIFSDLSMASPLHPNVVGFFFWVQFLSPFCTHVSLTIFVGNGRLWSRLSIWSLDRCFDWQLSMDTLQ